MRRWLLNVVGLVAIVVGHGCAYESTVNRSISLGETDKSEIYRAFLGKWTEGIPTSVSRVAEAPSPEDLESLSKCAGSIRWMPVESMDDITDIVGNLPHVQLADPAKWRHRDSGSLIAEGQSIESAVANGFTYGLLTLSAIAFDESRKAAAFTYFFSWADSSASGGSIIFRATPDGWVQADKACSIWITHLQRAMPNNALQATGLALRPRPSLASLGAPERGR